MSDVVINGIGQHKYGRQTLTFDGDYFSGSTTGNNTEISLTQNGLQLSGTKVIDGVTYSYELSNYDSSKNSGVLRLSKNYIPITIDISENNFNTHTITITDSSNSSEVKSNSISSGEITLDWKNQLRSYVDTDRLRFMKCTSGIDNMAQYRASVVNLYGSQGITGTEIKYNYYKIEQNSNVYVNLTPTKLELVDNTESSVRNFILGSYETFYGNSYSSPGIQLDKTSQGGTPKTAVLDKIGIRFYGVDSNTEYKSSLSDAQLSMYNSHTTFRSNYIRFYDWQKYYYAEITSDKIWFNKNTSISQLYPIPLFSITPTVNMATSNSHFKLNVREYRSSYDSSIGDNYKVITSSYTMYDDSNLDHMSVGDVIFVYNDATTQSMVFIFKDSTKKYRAPLNAKRMAPFVKVAENKWYPMIDVIVSSVPL